MTAVARLPDPLALWELPNDFASSSSVSVPRPTARSAKLSRNVGTVPPDEPLAPPPRPPSRSERRFACTFEGCDKAYFKPSRLIEHELSHTGERPHNCPHCEQSYLRASHLHAHLRTHQSNEARSFECTREGCDKRFWTATHLKRHERMHDEAETHTCEHCQATFTKTHLLRDHISLTHLPPGTKPYLCTTDGCSSSFSLKQHLRAHEKTHDPTRYACYHASHGEEVHTFPKWSALQAHLHDDHPPSCPHEECGGRVFKSAQRLKDHLKVHKEREADMAKGVSDKVGERDRAESKSTKKRRRSELEDGGKSPKLARLVDGEAGKEHACEDEGCGKRFKTRFALKTHRQSCHLGIKTHVCLFEGCDKSYAHKSSLAQHLASHARSDEPSEPNLAGQVTGQAAVERRFGCPEVGCDGRFWRVYDVKRHLKAEHGMNLDDTEVRHFLAKEVAEEV